MNLDLAPEEAAFRDEVRTFLEENLPPLLRESGQLTVSAFTDKDFNLPWHKILYRKGWVAPTWPVEYGGTGWTEMQRYIWSSECARIGTPALSPMGQRYSAKALAVTFGDFGMSSPTAVGVKPPVIWMQVGWPGITMSQTGSSVIFVSR